MEACYFWTMMAFVDLVTRGAQAKKASTFDSVQTRASPPGLR